MNSLTNQLRLIKGFEGLWIKAVMTIIFFIKFFSNYLKSTEPDSRVGRAGYVVTPRLSGLEVKFCSEVFFN